ncbi:MAG: RNase adapter RapZ [Actinomycetia bacterium]|nr:RNase adapter RapZ [Actinomycetes bacterium]
MNEFVVITGMSGAGRSHAANYLEDLGWFVIDNLPPSLIDKVSELVAAPGSTINQVALVVGTSRYVDEILPAIGALRRQADRVRILFLDCATDELVRRYETTRRRHPFDEHSGVGAAIESERVALEPLRAEADVTVDTSDLNVHQLRDRIRDLFAEDVDGAMKVSVLSFAFKHGMPLDVDLVFDCRFLPNPHWIEELRPRTGLDAPVRDYVLDQEATRPFLTRLVDMLTHLLPAYVQEGKSYLTVAFGCTGGHHRSVAISEEIAAQLATRGWNPSVAHRDIER